VLAADVAFERGDLEVVFDVDGHCVSDLGHFGSLLTIVNYSDEKGTRSP
jgi:hypothetical protein